MTGYEILERALRLTGREQLDENMKIIGLQFLSAILEEMGYRQPESLSHKVSVIGQSDIQTAVYGLSMLIANSMGDGEQRLAFSEIYNRRLAGIKSRTDRVKDRIFGGGKGEIQ